MAHSITQEKITLKVEDGASMDCWTARPSGGGSRPGILVLQEAFGVNNHIRNVSNRFAEAGYVAIAPELFHRTAPGFEGDYKNFSSVMPHMQAMTRDQAIADLRAAFQWLTAQSAVEKDRICSAGFCMGGRISFLANTALPLRAAASFYGGCIAPELLDRVPSLHGPMLLFWGGRDKHVGPEQKSAVIEALVKNGKSYVNVEFSDADHGFFCDERPSYNARAARESWALLMEFLQR